MAVTISQLITIMDRHTGDTTNDRFSQADRYDAITEACVWLQESHQSELQNFTYQLPYYDTINEYNVTTILADILMSSDLRKLTGENFETFTFKDGKELQRDIANGLASNSYTIERYDRKAYIVINHPPKYSAVVISDFESLTDGGGTWAADTSTSDMSNLAVDQAIVYHGNYSLSFDVTVAQSVNNRATLSNSTLTAQDFTNLSGISSAFMEVYIPVVTNFSSITLYWGSDSSNYWSVTATTQASGAAFVVGRNTIRFDWTASTTKTGTPTVTAIDYCRIDFNYAAGYTNTTGFRVDYLRFCRPETLTLNYLSSNVGQNASGTAIALFGASTDTPFFSGQYDNLKYAVAHYSAAVLLQDNRLFNEANNHFMMADERLKKAKDVIPTSRTRESKNFRPHGINFNKK